MIFERKKDLDNSPTWGAIRKCLHYTDKNITTF